MGDFKRVLSAMPPQNQQFILRDRQAFLHQLGVMRKLAQMAEKEKLDQRDPYKDQIDFARMQILASAKLTNEMQATLVEPDQLVKYYDANKDKYKQVKVKAIYISFGGAAAANANSSSIKKPRTEEEAKAKAEKLLADIRGGADFVTLVKESSDDETSKAKDGDFGTWKANDNIPDALRAAVFALKQGDVSEPIKQPNGFYLLKADEVKVSSLDDVRNEIYQTVKNQRYGEWMKDLDSSTKVQYPNAAFLGTAPAQPPAAPAKPAGK